MNETLRTIKIELDKLHKDWSDIDEDGHCKSSEGAIEVIHHYDNWFEAEDYVDDKPYGITVRIYSYLFGDNRWNEFDSFEEALLEVRGWQRKWNEYRLRETKTNTNN